jgi:phosphoglycolate phosphatase
VEAEPPPKKIETAETETAMSSPIVVFDLDGTLADTAGDLIGTLNLILEEEGLEPILLKPARDLIGAGAKALIARGFAASGRDLTPQRHEELFHHFLDLYQHHLADSSVLFPGVDDALGQLTAAGYKLAVCTNKVERHAVMLLEALDAAERFATITGRDTFAFHKPDPRHLTETIIRAGGDARRAVMVGDSRTDIDTAKAAGIPVIALPFGYTDTPVAQLDPDLVIDHYDRLPDAVRSLGLI